MDRIPMPNTLDVDRMASDTRDEFIVDHEARAQRLSEALQKTTDYAQRLWHELDAMRGYLLESAPPNPRTQTGPVTRRGASPTGPQDEAGWQAWTSAVASVTTLLTGPNGDSGYGQAEAEREARDRRLPSDAVHNATD